MIGFWLALVAGSHVWAAAVSGSLKSSTDQYAQSLGAPTETLIPYGVLDLNSKYKFTKKTRLQWKLVAIGNFTAKSEGATEEMPFNEQAFVDLPEGYLETKIGQTKLRAGMNTVNWGVVDGYSPSNVVNTSAYFHPLRTPKRGSPMVEAQLGGEDLALHALYIPYQPRAILPATNSRWLPRDVLANIGGTSSTIYLPNPIEYAYDSEVQLDRARRDNYGAKLSSHMGSFDFQVTHFDGASPFPKIKIIASAHNVGSDIYADSPVHLEPVSYRQRTTGAGATYAGEEWIFRFESAYTHVLADKNERSGYGLHRYSWTSVAGAETNFNFGRSTLTVLGQYYHSEIPGKADNQLASSFRLFDRTAVLGVRWPFRENWTLNATSLFETQTDGLFWTAGIENKIKDVFKWGLGWRDFSAQDNGLLKTFDKNDHACLDVTYFF